MSDQVPKFVVKLDGAAIEQADEQYLQLIKVDLRRQAPASVEIQFNNKAGDYGKGDKFSPGKAVDVQLGYTTREPKSVFHGEIIGTMIKVAENGPRVFTLRAFDLLHKLTRGRKTRTFLQQKFSDIVGQVSQEGGLTADAEDTQFQRDYVIQHNQTDLDFLRGIAGWLDYDFCIDHTQDASKTLRFKPPDVGGDAAVVAAYENPKLPDEVYLRKFDVRQSLARVVSEVVVRGWNPAQKAEIVGRASASDIYGNMGGQQSAADEVIAQWGETERQLTDYKVFSQEEADAIAKTKINEYARTFLRADMEIQGDARLHPGRLVQVKLVGERYDGLYLIESATHIFKAKVSAGGGYTTRVTAARCGW